MNPRVLEATAIEGHKLKLLFDNEEQRFYDCSGLLNFGMFQELQDKSYFKKVKAVDGTVVWPHGQDICPDTLYLELALLHEYLVVVVVFFRLRFSLFGLWDTIRV